MGLFDIFKKATKVKRPDKGIAGPTFFDGLTENVIDPKNLQRHEWRRKLKSGSEQVRFKIKFYGQLHHKYSNLIVATEFAPALIFALDPTTDEEILLFDGCRHGYNAMFCDTYSKEQIQNRPTTNFYRAQDGSDTFEIVISTYNSVDYDDEFAADVDENGLIELIDGTKIEFESARRNGFDTLQIFGTTGKGEIIEIVSEELA